MTGAGVIADEQRDIEAAIGRAFMMCRKRRQILVEADLQRLVGGGRHG